MNKNKPTTLGYIIDDDDRIISIEGEWEGFASANGAPELTRSRVLGRPIWEFIEGPDTTEVHRLLFSEVRARGGLDIALPFRCDGPQVRRDMRMMIGRSGAKGIEIRSQLIRELRRPYSALLDVSVRRSDELLRVCSWCNKVNLAPRKWVEVEHAIRNLRLLEDSPIPGITHGMCEVCLGNFYEELNLDRPNV